MEQKVTIAGVAIVASLLVLMGYLLIANPMKERQQQLNRQIEAIQPIEVVFEPPKWDFDKWQNSIAAKPKIWQDLVEAPPPPPPPPEKPPDLGALLKGVSPTRQQVGSKIKIITGTDPKGVFMQVGDTINGLTIKSIEKTEIIFSLMWQGKELTTSLPKN